jgi:hypothetical protein
MKYIDVPRLSAYLIFPAVYRPTLANYLTNERMACLKVVPLHCAYLWTNIRVRGWVLLI